MKQKQYIDPTYPVFLHGGDYNPDQWIASVPDIIDQDMRLMKLANCNAMTAGIFAWAALEPQEGSYDFSVLDEVMDKVYAAGGRVVLATPSGARPAWMAVKYPEVLRVESDLVRRHQGIRHNHCYTSPIYREKVDAIDRALAERYRNHPALLCWHLSNEYSGACYCPLCQAAFRAWLKEKYGTLDALNHQWWTAFWAHTYTDWEQIEAPIPKGETHCHGLTLDWQRFVTHQTTDFMKAEIAAIRAFDPATPITTNMMGFYTGLDYRVLAKELDVISWDSYPAWRGDASDVDTACSFAMIHDLNRSMLHKPFMLMESTPSNVNWHDYNKLKRPGVHIQSSLQAVAHGSDTVQYFQWRKSRGSWEKFHGAVVDHVGHENTRVFREVSALGGRLKALQPVCGTGTQSRVALLYDWENRWALDNAQSFQREDKKLMETMTKHYRPFWCRGINTDIISSGDDFTAYDLIVAPMQYMVGSVLEQKLADYVAKGGRLMATYMTGMVNENDLTHLGGFPAGRLKQVFGIWNEEIDTLYPGETNRVTAFGQDFTAVDYCELLHPDPDTRVLAAYASDFYAGQPAATVHDYGKGKAYYLAFRDTGDFTDRLTGDICAELGIVSDFDAPLPVGVTAHSRTDGEAVYVFLENFTGETQSLTLPTLWRDVETGEEYQNTVVLQPHQTLVLTR